MIRMYYVNCGVYNSFIEEVLGLKARCPQFLYEVIHAFLTDVIRILLQRVFFINVKVIVALYCRSQTTTRNLCQHYGDRRATRTMSLLRTC